MLRSLTQRPEQQIISDLEAVRTSLCGSDFSAHPADALRSGESEEDVRRETSVPKHAATFDGQFNFSF